MAKAGVAKFVALAACCAVVFAAFTVPSVRAAAQAFLDVFRVVHIVGVPVGQQVMQRLHNSELDLPHLLGNQVEVLKSTVPVAYSTVQEAGAAAGFQVQLPAWMPVGWDTEVPAIKAGGEKAAQVTRVQDVIRMRLSDEESMPRLANWLVQRGLKVYELRSRRRSLEEWFVEIMGDGQRPG